jgi:hypothetical protein
LLPIGVDLFDAAEHVDFLCAVVANGMWQIGSVPH